MIANVNQFLGTVTESELARTARHSARTIFNAHLAALETTRVEAGKLFAVAIGEGKKLARRARPAPAARRTTRRKPRRAA